MKKYIKVKDGKVVQYPVSQSQIVNAHPEVSFPSYPISDDLMASYDCYPVQEEVPPPVDFAQRLKEVTPVKIGGAWVQSWVVEDITGSELDELHAQLKRRIVAETQARLDNFANTREYDGILSAASYATSTNPTRRAEGQYAVDARDETWDVLYAILDDVIAKKRPIPKSFSEIEDELPALVWPV